jgi:hypothetical protein
MPSSNSSVDEGGGEAGDQLLEGVALDQRLLGGHAVGDVLEEGDGVIERAVGRADGGDGEAGPERGAVGAQMALLDREGIEFSREQGGEAGGAGLLIVGVGEIDGVAPAEVVGGAPEEVAEGAVDAEEAAIRPDIGDANGREVEDRLEVAQVAQFGHRGLPPARRADGSRGNYRRSGVGR